MVEIVNLDEQRKIREISDFKFQNLKGVEGIIEAYTSIFDGNTQPKTQGDVCLILSSDKGYEKICDMYYYLFPMEAYKVQEEHENNEKYKRTVFGRLLHPSLQDPFQKIRYWSSKKAINK